ncbi:MAG TPA: NAD(P)H-quinone oxidoreductase [Rhodothermales bacterium]|nr:NAD(P)H-quinone oxidoreductase [Rhodothermales bacterium]
MKAVLVREAGGADNLYLGEAPRPAPAPGEILVRVHATALNRADILQREGKYPPPEGASPILGLEMAGAVETVGAAVDRWRPGDRVCALLPGGGYAEYVAVPQDVAMAVPPALSFEDAAAIPEVFLTAYQALYWYGKLEEGSHVLIHAGASGVGTAAIQLARAAGAHPYVTASAGKLDACRRLGAELAVDYRSEDFAERVLAHTHGHGADVIIDFIGAPYLKSNVETLAVDGRIILLATMGGSRVEDFDLRALFRKRGQFITSALRSRSHDYKRRLTREFAAYAMPLFERGILRPVIDSTFDWSDAPTAHRRMESNQNTGKIILHIP